MPKNSPLSEHKAALVGYDDAGLDAEFIGFPGFAFADAFDFRGMQGVKFVLVFGLLLADAFCPFEQGVQMGDGHRRLAGRARQFEMNFAQHDAE